MSLAYSESAHAPGQVADRLAELALQGASGTLEFDGDPGGIIYLSTGRLAFAESAAVPDPGSPLVNSRLSGYDLAPDARLRLQGRSRLVFGREASPAPDTRSRASRTRASGGRGRI